MIPSHFLKTNFNLTFPQTEIKQFGVIELACPGHTEVQIKVVGPMSKFEKNQYDKVQASVLLKDNGQFLAAMAKLSNELILASENLVVLAKYSA